jgi:hypothetical protein
MLQLRTGTKEDNVTAMAKPGGMVAPKSAAIKLQILFSPAPINPAMAPPFRACTMVGFFVFPYFCFLGVSLSIDHDLIKNRISLQ